MKARRTAEVKAHARTVLASFDIVLGRDFHTLSASDVDALLAVAAAEGYRKPRNANGSRGRYFHDRLQRLAR